MDELERKLCNDAYDMLASLPKEAIKKCLEILEEDEEEEESKSNQNHFVISKTK